MNKQEKQIRIAAACGKGHRKVTGMEALSLGMKLGSYVQSSDYPDYFGDLNACHEMEKMLRKPMKGSDSDSIIGDRMHNYAELIGYAFDATAAQRAEAFGLTLGLWKSETETNQ